MVGAAGMCRLEMDVGSDGSRCRWEVQVGDSVGRCR